MKIVHINTYNTGGAAKACLRLHDALLNKNINSKVVLLYKTDDSIPEVYDFRDYNRGSLQFWIDKFRNRIRNDYDRIRLALKSPSAKPFSFPNTTWDIMKHPFVKEADIIHLHWVAGFLDYDSFFKQCHQKIIWTLHDELPFSGGYHYENDWTESINSALLNKNIEIKLAALAKTNIDIICLSNYIHAKSIKSKIFQSYQHHQIKNGVTAGSFSFKNKNEIKTKLNLPLNKKMILYIADNINYKRKGFSYFYEAINKIDLRTNIAVIVGTKRPVGLPENKSIRFYEKINEELMMSDFYSAADVLVIPSLEDNQPNVMTEALCCGLPIVAFKNTGIIEMINEQNGIFAQHQNADSLASAIEEALVSTTFNAEAIATAAKKIYCDTIMAEKHIELYNKRIHTPTNF